MTVAKRSFICTISSCSQRACDGILLPETCRRFEIHKAWKRQGKDSILSKTEGECKIHLRIIDLYHGSSLSSSTFTCGGKIVIRSKYAATKDFWDVASPGSAMLHLNPYSNVTQKGLSGRKENKDTLTLNPRKGWNSGRRTTNRC